MSIKIAKYDNSFLQVENYFNFLYSVKDMNLSSSFFVGFLSKIGSFQVGSRSIISSFNASLKAYE